MRERERTAAIVPAESKARRMAERAEAAGLTAELRVNFRPATLYADGQVMLSATTSVSLMMREPKWYGTTLAAQWITRHRHEGRRESTMFAGGDYMPMCGRGRKLRRERDVRLWIDVLGTGRAKEEEARDVLG